MLSGRLGALAQRLEFLKSPLPMDALKASAGYLRRRPGELVTVAKNAAGLRLTIPLDALRWLNEHLNTSAKGPKDVSIAAAAPALALGATSQLMGNAFRVAADLRVEEVRAGADELQLVLRIGNLALTALGSKDSPMANLFKAMDLSKPGQLLSFLPARPPALVEAKDDRFVIDLLKVPKIAANPVVRRALEVVTPLLSIGEVRTEDDHLVIALRTRAGGLSAALAALRRPA
jgi:hypothetical protein